MITSAISRLSILVCAVACTALLGLPSTGSAAPAGIASVIWSTPKLLYSTSEYASGPIILDDSAGNVHVLFTSNHQQGETMTGGQLLYTQLRDGQWSAVTDVAVAPDGGAIQQPAAAIDSHGILHVVFQGGNGRAIYYTHAFAADAVSGAAWSAPQRLSSNSGTGDLGTVDSIAIGPDDVLHVTYAGQDGNIYYRQSSTGGNSWAPTTTVADTSGFGSAADHPRLAVDDSGNLYLAWTQLQLPTGWPPAGTFFASSRDSGKTWSDAARVAGPNTGAPNVIVADGVIQRVWDTVADLGQRWHQFSSDGGKTWSTPDEIAPSLSGGFTGYPGMAIDSAGHLHVVTAVDGGQHQRQARGVYHMVWDGSQWGQPTYISLNALGKRSIEQPKIAISRGNRLHVVYEDDFQRIWYTTSLVDAVTLPAVPLPATAPGAQQDMPTPQALSTPAPTAFTAPVVQPSLDPTLQAASPPAPAPIHPLVFAAIPTVLLLAVLVGRRLARSLND